MSAEIVKRDSIEESVSIGKLGDIERFADKIRFNSDGCIIWTAAVDRKGYGRFRLRSRQVFAHRYSYECFVGFLPATLSVLHRCDNPSCVNPQHLFTGTQADNIADMLAKGRHRIGSRHQNARLTEIAVGQIKILLGVLPQSQLAKQFGVSQTTISHIATGQTWRHV